MSESLRTPCVEPYKRHSFGLPGGTVFDHCRRCGADRPKGSNYPTIKPPNFNRDELQVIDTALERFVDDDVFDYYPDAPGTTAIKKLDAWFQANPTNKGEAQHGA